MNQTISHSLAALHSPCYQQVKRRIFRQLVESLLYEGLLRAEEQEQDGVLHLALDGVTATGEPVRYTCQAQRRLTFGRVRLLDAPLQRHASGTTEEADSLTGFLLEMQPVLGADPERVKTFSRELEQTLLNDTLAQHHRRENRLSYAGCTYDQLEGRVMDAHPYHPSYKSRIGFDDQDLRDFGPEFEPDLQPLWVAAHREFTRFALSKLLEWQEFLLTELGAEQLDAFQAQLQQAGLNPDDYLYLPVHPWQWHKTILPALHEDLRTQRLVLLGHAADTYRPQQSIRTLANHTSPERSYVKLSLSIINTSTGRVLAPHTVQNAPLVTDWLRDLVAGDPFLQEESRVILLGEVAGVSYDRPPRADLVQSNTYGVLGCIWRDSLHRFLLPGEEAVPYNALTSLDLDGRPLIAPWIEAQGTENWLTDLFEKTVLPIIHLLYAHGLSLESHGQNMVLVHENGRPARVALKDFHDGVRFSPAHLREPEKRPPLLDTPEAHARVNRNSFLETDDLAAVRDFMHDAFFFINIGELALFLADRFDYAEEDFWRLLHEVIVRYQERFPELRERFELFDLFAPTIFVEQLTKRRLFPDTELRIHEVPNPLSLSVLSAHKGV